MTVGPMRRSIAFVLAAAGIALFAFGGAWAPAALELVPDNEAGVWLELLIPFLPMAPIVAAAVVYRPPGKDRRRRR